MAQTIGEYEAATQRMIMAQVEAEIIEHPERFERCPDCGELTRKGDIESGDHELTCALGD